MKPKTRAFLKVVPYLILGLVLIGQVATASGFSIKKIDVPGAFHTYVQGLNDKTPCRAVARPHPPPHPSKVPRPLMLMMPL